MKFNKCKVQLKEVAFLGHIVSGDGIMVDPEKIKVVNNWPKLLSPVDIRSYLGLAKHYRSFLEGFSYTTLPLTKLTQNKVKFK